MNKKELNYIKENYFSNPAEELGLELIYEMIDEVY
jgi:hypothetical protein